MVPPGDVGVCREEDRADRPSVTRPRSRRSSRAASRIRRLSCPCFRRPLHVGAGVRRTKGHVVKVVVIGGTGLIGSKLVTKLGEHGHEAVPAAPSAGVNTLTGEGLAEVL